MSTKRVDEFVDLAFHLKFESVDGQVDAVIGEDYFAM